mmetsp:Transcript_6234/g.14912  ORF Transcript_6234/g.14912 Transcript_6234/m.14912 type:complete len:504 (-) Transcript_6234:44-1555(-)
MTEVKLFVAKASRYGVLAASVIPDPAAALQIETYRQQFPLLPAQDSSSSADAADPLRSQNGRVVPPTPGPLTRQQILELLEQTAHVQGIVQQEISTLARTLVSEKPDRKKKKQMSFLDAYNKMLELKLPKDPLERHGLTEAGFQQLLHQYEEDAEVMESAQLLLHPTGKGDPERAKELKVVKIIEIHQFMVTEMQKVIQEFRQIPSDVRRTFTGKGCETTAELLVSMAVEQRLAVRCEDVEQAVILHENELQANADFARCTDQLAELMHQLIGSVQLRVQKPEFAQILRHLGESSRKAKAFGKKLYDDFRNKSIGINEAYRQFEEFAEQSMQEAAHLQDLPQLTPVEITAAFEEYGDDPEVRQLFEQIGPAYQLQPDLVGATSKLTKPRGEDNRKGRKALRPSELTEIQVHLVEELRRIVKAVGARDKTDRPWKGEVAVQMAHALSNAAIERRYGATAEEVANASVQHAGTLQRSERFVRSTEEQHKLLTKLSKLCSGAGGDT